MARELAIEITAETASAEAALARVDEGMRRIATTSETTSRSLEDVEKRVDRNIGAIEKKYADQEQAAKKAQKATEQQARSMGDLEAAVRRYAAPAVIGFAIKQTLEYADSVATLANRLSIAPGRLQALEFSAKQFNITLDPLARSIGMMSDRIGSGDKSAVAAIERLGLSFKTIRSLAPDAAFIEIARAVAQVEDPMQRAADATDIFGRTGLELLPLLTSDIDALMKKAKQLGFVMEDETTKAAADLNDQLGNLVDTGKRLIMVFFAPLLPILSPLITGIGFLTAELGKMITTILSPLAQMREFAELLGVIASKVPTVPKGPGATFLPGQLPTMGIPDTTGLFPSGRSGGGGRSNVLPFVRPGYEPMDPGYAAWLQQARGPMGGFGGGFSGWATSPTLGDAGFTGGLPFAPYAGTVGMNRPGLSTGGFMSGAGGRFLGAGLGMATQFLPGMSGMGANIGSGLGGALGGLKGVTGMLGSFAPFLGPLAGIAGGLIGKLFGPSEADKTRDARGSFIEDFGGMGALQTAAGKAGFDLSGLMGAKKQGVLEQEIRKLEKAITDFDDKVVDAQRHLDGLNSELHGTLTAAKDLGYNFDKEGKLVSVSFEKMQEKAKQYGLDLDALGPAFQKQRLHEAATTIINDFELLTLGGADVGTVLSGMSDEINTLVNDSIKFGTEIPANMEPWIKELITSNKLVDENGMAITDLGALKFAAPIETEFAKITAKLTELVDGIAAAVAKLDELTRPRTVQIGYQVDVPPDVPLDYSSGGGFVRHPKYLAGGWVPRGTDTVPAMLTPGEGVMRREAVSRLMRGDWPQGGGGMSISIDSVTVGSGARSEAEFEVQIGRAVVQGLKRKGVRLNAA
jgi:Skp family chaperone for outer membrane proteins